MRTEAQRSYEHGFVLTEEELRRIVAVAIEQVRKATGAEPEVDLFSIHFRNGAISDTHSVDDVLAQENMGTSAITRLELVIQSGVKDKDWSVQLSFIDADREDGPGSTSIRYRISGNERDWVFVTSSMIEERIKRIRRLIPGKLWTRRGSLSRLLIVGAPALGGLALLLIGTRHGTRVRNAVIDSLAALNASGQPVSPLDAMLRMERARIRADQETLGFGLYNPLLMMFILPVVIILILFALGYLYPTYNFVWGDYEAVFKRRQAVARGVLLVVGGGLVIGIVANILTRKLGF